MSLNERCGLYIDFTGLSLSQALKQVFLGDTAHQLSVVCNQQLNVDQSFHIVSMPLVARRVRNVFG